MAVDERLLAVEFGPSRSRRFPAAVCEAEQGPGGVTTLGPGRYRVRFLLGEDAAAYAGLGRLLERVRHWRATEVYEDDEGLVSVFQAREMAWCASFQLGRFEGCRERFQHGVLPRCALCPLFDPERAIRAQRPDPLAPTGHVQISPGPNLFFDAGPEPDFSQITSIDFLFNPDLLAQLGGELPEWMDLSPLIPDYPPADWGPAAESDAAG